MLPKISAPLRIRRAALCVRAALLLCVLVATPVSAQTPLCGFTRSASFDSVSLVQSAGTAFLDRQWRVHSGDDLRWATPEFDDSNWVSTPITDPFPEQMRRVAQKNEREGQHGIVWLRRRLKFADTTQCRAFALLQPSGPAEFYINGKLVLSSGDVSQRARGASANLYSAPMEMTMPAGTLTLAVRVNLAAAYDVARSAPPVQTQFNAAPDYAEVVRQIAVTAACAGVLVALGMLHLLLFFARRTQRENFYFAFLPCALVRLSPCSSGESQWMICAYGTLRRWLDWTSCHSRLSF